VTHPDTSSHAYAFAVQTLPALSIVPEVAEVFSLFCALTNLAANRFSGELGGKFLLYPQLDAHGAAITIAANIAGVATLGIDHGPERLKQGIRHGYCDFLVNHLDEALRILKNEVRKKQPVSVCLQADFAVTLHEIVARGVQPDILAFPTGSDDAQLLIERGAIALEANEHQPQSSPEVESHPDPKELIAVNWTAKSAAALSLPKVDALAAEILPRNDPRQRWLKFAPRYLGRPMSGSHYLKMTAEEASRFTSLITEATNSGIIPTDIAVTRNPSLVASP
jgi:urocanate hydratase